VLASKVINKHNNELTRNNNTKTKPKVKQTTVRTAHKCVYIIVHNHDGG